MPKSKAEEIAELQALIDMMPDDSDEEAIEEYEKTEAPDKEEILEIQYRRKVKRKNWVGSRFERTCEACGVTYYESLPGRYDGRLCGENCATIELDNARELLESARDFANTEWIVRLEENKTLSRVTAEHLQSGPTPDLKPAPVPGAIMRPAPKKPVEAPPTEPQTIAEKIAASLKK